VTLRVHLRPEAEQDLEAAAGWYEAQQPGLGQRFYDEVLRGIESIRARPTMYPSVGRGARRALIGRFPYGLYYLVEADSIVIVAVMHGSRSPRRWKRRA